jgi:hypothetical protein
MTPERLQELYHFAWDQFYKQESQSVKMFKLFQQVIRKEKEDGSFRPRQRGLSTQAFGKVLQ